MKAIRTIAICTALLMIGSACMAASPVRGGKAPRDPAKSGDVNAEWWGPGPGAPGRNLVVHGTVLQVDASSIQIQTVARGAMQFAVTDKTQVIVRGKRGGIADIQKGDVVNLKFKPVPNGTPIALGIQVPKDAEAGQESPARQSRRGRGQCGHGQRPEGRRESHRGDRYQGSVQALSGLGCRSQGRLRRGCIRGSQPHRKGSSSARWSARAR